MTYLGERGDLRRSRGLDVVYCYPTVRGPNEVSGYLRYAFEGAVAVFEIENGGPVVREVFRESAGGTG